MPRILSLLLALLFSGLAAVDPPKLTSHPLPPILEPPTRFLFMAWVDVGVLFVAMGIAAWLVVKKRSRIGMMILSAACLAYFGFYRGGCVCPIGAIQPVSDALVNPAALLSFTVLLIFLLPLLFTLIWGRVFCGAVCPLGAIQDLVLIRPVQLPLWVDKVFGLMAWIYLILGISLAVTGATWLICDYDPFVGLFRLSGSKPMIVLGFLFLALGTMVGRPYCRFLCPYGAILRLLSPQSAWQLKIYPDACVKCSLCDDACPFGAILPATAPTEGAKPKRSEKLIFISMLILVPVLIVGGSLIGTRLAGPLSRLHSDVRLVDTIVAERSKKVPLSAASEEHRAFFLKQKGDYVELQTRAQKIHDRLAFWLMLGGGLVGLIAGARLLSTTIRRIRHEYQADPAQCVSCARCFEACPGACKKES
jgi:ferredoxin